MKAVSGLLEHLDGQVIKGTVEGEISALVYDSRKVTKDCMFVCIKGAAYDSHEHTEEVVNKGARVIVAERSVEVPEGVTLVLVPDTRCALALLSAAYFDHPARKLKVIGITGTKGKTTTTFMVREILEHAGYKVGLMGTIETIIGEKRIPANNTTPESYMVQEYFAQMVEAGCQV
ncbi:MAG: UDP-N-acetylmuramoyl-L-alanyl-D-glutamate--2,6-diaminopimelate ligase, partial [Lachnospiraceae bacterium]|nr:UDP-N-acetylmuramoyl-L-alanyl-D-glutamate--2,6-diaminopimelate ligase [Lachnospiraceae bacterium]